MSSTFTPSNIVDMSKERDWAASLGMLDWDNTSIVFTKRTLIEFLKYTGTTVDTNFNNIGKLPRYAKFGKISEPSEARAEDNATGTTSTGEDDFIPSRRVRTVPGGPHTDIFARDDEGDALSHAPPRSKDSQPPPAATIQDIEESEAGINFESSVKPSRRVREMPGGTSSMANLWDSEEAPQSFKPTRRVREGPGGKDSINLLNNSRTI
ncbi:hypothetical protein GALMADRAFT_608054 [Galerina marginata CBS 339.88]|uniref:Uncharacterized protein n=1 Tax=Galerina marginata (strain CBS 339.88) TaxID=685588 RepID=A0A067SRA5_GALM3|nr:hypothetical protein GALMADRAFT_608054 [Galerina marginata CBS 339.88]